MSIFDFSSGKISCCIWSRTWYNLDLFLFLNTSLSWCTSDSDLIIFSLISMISWGVLDIMNHLHILCMLKHRIGVLIHGRIAALTIRNTGKVIALSFTTCLSLCTSNELYRWLKKTCQSSRRYNNAFTSLIQRHYICSLRSLHLVAWVMAPANVQ